MSDVPAGVGTAETAPVGRIDAEISARMDEFTPAERKVARTLLAGYPATGLDSAANVARSAGTSTPTVLRLVTRLGYGSYPNFQARLREETVHHLNSPVQRSRTQMAMSGTDPLLAHAVSERRELVSGLLDSVPPSEFERAVTAIAQAPKKIAMIGGYFSRYFAMIAVAQLDQILLDVSYLAEPLGHDASRFAQLGRGSVVVIMDFRRHERSARDLAAAARQRGACVLVITDTSLSQAVESADVVLPVPVSGIPFDSMTSLLTLIEALVEGVLRAKGKTGLDRMKQWEDAVSIPRAYRASAIDHGPQAVGGANLAEVLSRARARGSDAGAGRTPGAPEPSVEQGSVEQGSVEQGSGEQGASEQRSGQREPRPEGSTA